MLYKTTTPGQQYIFP